MPRTYQLSIIPSETWTVHLFQAAISNRCYQAFERCLQHSAPGDQSLHKPPAPPANTGELRANHPAFDTTMRHWPHLALSARWVNGLQWGPMGLNGYCWGCRFNARCSYYPTTLFFNKTMMPLSVIFPYPPNQFLF